MNREFTRLQKEIINKLVNIEELDDTACATCGGEDCICCSIYHDRNTWKNADDLFSDDF